MALFPALNHKKLVPLILMAIGIFARAAVAQNAPPEAEQPDPEDRNHGVARVSLMNGDVSVRRGDSGDFVAAQINAPLLAADSVQTGQSSRAEVQLDFANRVRLSSGTEVRMGELRAGAFQIQIARGIATFSVLKDSQAQVELSTPSASIRPTRRGDYRIAVLDDGTTQITIRSGDAEIYTPQGSQRIASGQTMLIRGSASDPEYQVVGGVAQDEWDTFNERRDHELESSTVYQHVSTDIQGAEDLDSYGRWQQDPTYGQVWTPNVAADWAPYQGGRWVWGDYYGWTWVSTDPWGWAPYHYGNWFRASYGWSWYPGAYRSHYWYRPALVGFFGFGGGGFDGGGFGGGSGFGLGFGFGNIGWCPLAPFERFHPWWGRGYGRGFTNINVVNNVNIYNTYRNARAFNGVSSVTAQQFQNGQFGRVSHPGAGLVQNAGLVRGQLPVTPSSANLRFNDRQTSATARSGFQQQNFVSRGGFSQPQRTSFEQQRQTLQQTFSGGRGVQQPLGAQANGAQAGREAGRSSMNTQPQRQENSGSAWQRFGNPNGGPSNTVSPRASAPSNAGQANSSQGWGRFGNPNGSSSSPSNTANQGQAPRSDYSNRYDSGIRSNPQPRNFSGSGNFSQGSQGSQGRSVQIAPQIVQPRFQGSSQGNYRQSAPPASRPTYSAPSRQSSPAPSRQSSPAPSRQSSGGGNSGHSSSSNNHGGGGGHR